MTAEAAGRSFQRKRPRCVNVSDFSRERRLACARDNAQFFGNRLPHLVQSDFGVFESLNCSSLAAATSNRHKGSSDRSFGSVFDVKVVRPCAASALFRFRSWSRTRFCPLPLKSTPTELQTRRILLLYACLQHACRSKRLGAFGSAAASSHRLR